MKEQFDVMGMTCSACAAHVEKSVKRVDGVQEVAVNLLGNSMSVEFDKDRTDPGEIIRAVQKGGYDAKPREKPEAGEKKRRKQEAAGPSAAEVARKNTLRRLIVSIVFLVPLSYLAMGPMMGLPVPGFLSGHENAIPMALTQLLLTLPILYENRAYFTSGFRALFSGGPNMDSLIAIGSAAAMIYGVYILYQSAYALAAGDMETLMAGAHELYFDSAGMILTLVTVGKYLEARSKGRTGDALARLLDLAPQNALVLRDGEEVEIPSEDLRVGDIAVVKAGQSVPADGEVVEGGGAVDESALTGESMPVEKKEGDRLTGATVNLEGYLKMRVLRVGDDSTLSQIIRLVEEAGGSKAPIARLADRVSGVFVPIVIAIALVSLAVWLLVGYPAGFALSRAISVLVISCPCALGLATPTAIMVGTGKGAEHGILIKSAESLETLRAVDTVALDKTGTVTEGRPQVTDILPGSGIGEAELLRLAASAEQASGHPLAKAVMERARQDGVTLLPFSDFTAIPGQGIRVTLEGREFLAGNRKMMQENNIPLRDFEKDEERLAREGKTPLYFASGNTLTGLIALADVIRPTSRKAIAEWREMGVRTVLFTGDNRRTAEAIGKQLGISAVMAEALPQDKERGIHQLQQEGRRLAMIGDGINDAPALARADVGVAIGAGTDVAIDSADIVLMGSDPLDAVSAMQLSRAVIRNIKQNLFWALCYNTLGIPLAAGVFFPLFGWTLNPMFAAAAMSLSSLFVVGNALRLRGFHPKWKTPEDLPEPDFPVEVRVAGEVVSNGGASALPENKKGGDQMQKTMKIEGMTCGHCSARVEKALNALDGVTATVDLEAGTAKLTLEKSVSDEALRKAVEDAGYEVTSVA